MNRHFKTIALALFVLLVLVRPLSSATSNREQSVRLPRVAPPPKLADFLAGGARPDELRVTEFWQREPNDGARGSQETAVYLSYDDKNLYAIFVCKEDPRKVRAHLGRRDDLADDDVVSIALDTFHDNRRAYEFLANPLGVQKDAIITEGQDDDFSFDTLWHSEGTLTPDGYVVRFEIPFKSLRFNSHSNGTWGIALGRYTPALKEFATWPHISEKIEAYVPQLAAVDAPTESPSGHNVQFIPHTSFAGQHFLNTPPDAAPSFRTRNEWRGGLDGKFVLRDALTFDFTANPDFSQVESDEPQVTINRRYEVFFLEKRPFFTEGAGFFQTPESLFFSRRIIDPHFGMRMTGKVGRWALGVLGMDDRAPGQLLSATDPLSGERAHIGIFRALREVGKESTVGFFLSQRDFGSNSNQVFSLDARLKINPNWVFTGQAVRSRAHDVDGSRISGADYFAEIRHTGLHFTYATSYLDRTPNFRADLGFIPRVDIRQVKNTLGYQMRPAHGALVSFGPTIYSRAIWDHRGQMQEWSLEAPFSFQFKGPTSFTVGRIEEFERYQNIAFRENASYVYFSTQRLRWVGIDSSFVHGTNINFFPAAGLLPFVGGSDDATLGVTFRPTSRTRVEETYIYNRLGTLASGQPVDVRSAPSIFNNHLWRTKVNYQFTRALSIRLIVDYNATLANPLLVNLDRSKRITGDILLTYLMNPGTALYVGYTDRRENLAFDPSSVNGLQRTMSPFFPTDRQLFVKLSYLFRF